jgi:hypothetical protein
MNKVTGSLGVVCLSFALAGMAQAAVILDGSTEPKNLVPGSGLQGVVNAAVFSLTGPASDPYGTGFSTLQLQAAGFSGAGTDAYLYLYQTDNTGSLAISENTVGWTTTSSFGQLTATSFSPNPIQPLTVPTNPSPFSVGTGATLVADGSAVTVAALLSGSTSLQANYGSTGLTTSQHSDVWGYTSTNAPQLDFTGLQDHGTNAEGLVPTGAAVPVPAAIWGGLGLLSALFTAKVSRNKK